MLSFISIFTNKSLVNVEREAKKIFSNSHEAFLSFYIFRFLVFLIFTSNRQRPLFSSQLFASTAKWLLGSRVFCFFLYNILRDLEFAGMDESKPGRNKLTMLPVFDSQLGPLFWAPIKEGTLVKSHCFMFPTHPTVHNRSFHDRRTLNHNINSRTGPPGRFEGRYVSIPINRAYFGCEVRPPNRTRFAVNFENYRLASLPPKSATSLAFAHWRQNHQSRQASSSTLEKFLTLKKQKTANNESNALTAHFCAFLDSDVSVCVSSPNLQSTC